MQTVVRKSKDNVTRRTIADNVLFQAWYGIPIVRETQATPVPIVEHTIYEKPLTKHMQDNMLNYFDNMVQAIYIPYCVNCKVKDNCLHYYQQDEKCQPIYSEIEEAYCINCNKTITWKRFHYIRQCDACKSFALGKRYHTIIDYYISNYKRYRINLKKNTITLQIETNKGKYSKGWKNHIVGMITRNWR